MADKKKSTIDSVKVAANKPAPVGAAKVVRKREFVDLVLSQVSSNRREAKQVVDATLLALSEMLQSQKTLAISPFGKARVTRVAGTKDQETFVVRFKPKADEDGTPLRVSAGARQTAQSATERALERKGQGGPRPVRGPKSAQG